MVVMVVLALHVVLLEGAMTWCPAISVFVFLAGWVTIAVIVSYHCSIKPGNYFFDNDKASYFNCALIISVNVKLFPKL